MLCLWIIIKRRIRSEFGHNSRVIDPIRNSRVEDPIRNSRVIDPIRNCPVIDPITRVQVLGLDWKGIVNPSRHAN